MSKGQACSDMLPRAIWMFLVMCIRHPSRLRDAYREDR